jgi:hypothetical protein
MHSTDAALRAAHAELICGITQEVNHYLDRQQRFNLLWTDIDHHIAASHLAEELGEVSLVRLHLDAVTRLMEEIYSQYPPKGNDLVFWFLTHGQRKPDRQRAFPA